MRGLCSHSVGCALAHAIGLVSIVMIILSSCSGPQSALNPAKLPFSMHLSCVVGEQDGSGEPVSLVGVDVRCEGTLGDPVCTTDAGVALSCSFFASTDVPFIGPVGASGYAQGGSELDEPWNGEVRACVFAATSKLCFAEQVPGE